MIKNKFDYCYEEGKEIGFVHLDYIDNNGKKHYKKCPGNEDVPGKINKECLNCLYLDKVHCEVRTKIAKQIEFNHFLRSRGIDIDN